MLKLSKSLRKIGLPLFVLLAYSFLYLPIFILIAFSFNNAAFPAPWQGFSLKWYYALFNSSEIWSAFYVSAIVAIVSTLLSTLISLSVVYYDLMNGQLNKLLYIFYSNVIIPEIVLAVALLGFFTYLSIPLSIVTLIIAHTVLTLGFVLPLIYNRYLSIDYGIIEASLDLGANQTQTFFKIVLPLLTPAIIASSLLAFIISFDDFILSFFCASGETQTLSLYIYSMIRAGVSPIVNALSTILLIFSSFLVLIFCLINIRSKDFLI